MFHDAPVEAAVVVHRHRSRATAAGNTSHEIPQRILHEYQLHRVVTFILTGQDGKNGEASSEAAPKPLAHEKVIMQRVESVKGEKPCCSACRTACTMSVQKSAPFMRVALQFPDDLLADSVAVVGALQRLLTSDPRYAAAMHAMLEAEGDLGSSASESAVRRAVGAAGTAASARPPAMNNPHRPVGEVRVFVLADNTFGSCCPDEITAQHYMADCIVHFGDACMSRSTRLPVLYIQPEFHFEALLSDSLRHADQLAPLPQAAALLEAEAGVVVGLVERIAVTLRRRVTAWWAEQGKAPSVPCTVVPRLAVVGTYPTKQILLAAERRWNEQRKADLGDAAVAVDWPRFEARNGIVPTGHGANPSAAAAEGGAATVTVNTEAAAAEDEEDWLVSGVRFPRLRGCASTATTTTIATTTTHTATTTDTADTASVQYLLFIGAAGTPALVHVLTAEQYNQFHYSDACHEFVEWDSGEETTSVPVVMVVNNTFAMEDSDRGANEKAALQIMVESSTPAQPCNGGLQSSVSAWLSAVLTDGVSALLAGDYVVAQQALQRRVRQRTFNIETVRASTAIGILVASLAIEGYNELTQQLHQLIRAYGKRSYVIYIGHLNEFKLANFVDTVDCFVVVACPYSRQSHFPEKGDHFMKPIVSPAELLVALTTSDDTAADVQYGMAAVYTTSFQASLRVLRSAVQARKKEVACHVSEDEASARRRKDEEAERWASSGALVHAGGGSGGDGALTVHESSQGALARLYKREYVGLDPRIGQTPVQTETIEGNHGIARGYAKEREEQHAEPPVSQYK